MFPLHILSRNILITNRLNRNLLYHKPGLAIIMYRCQNDEGSIHATNCFIISVLIIKMYRCIVISNFRFRMVLVATHTTHTDLSTLTRYI